VPPWLPEPAGVGVPMAALLVKAAPGFWKVAEVLRPTALAAALVFLAVRIARDGLRAHTTGALRWLLAAALAYAGPWMMMQGAAKVNLLEVEAGVAHRRFLRTAVLYSLSPTLAQPAFDDPDLAARINAMPEEEQRKVRSGLKAFAENAWGWAKSLWRRLKDLGGALAEDPLGLGANLLQWRGGLNPTMIVLTVMAHLAQVGYLAYMDFFASLLDVGLLLCVLLLGPVMLPLTAWERTHEWGVRPVSVFLYVCALKLAFVGHLYLVRYATAYFLYSQSFWAATQVGQNCEKVFADVDSTLEALAAATRDAQNEFALAERVYRFQTCLAENAVEVLRKAASPEEAERLGAALAQRANRSYTQHQMDACLFLLTSLLLGVMLPRLVRLVLPQELLHGVAVRALGALVGAGAAGWDRLVATSTSVGGAVGGTAGGVAGGVAGGIVGGLVGGPVGALVGAGVGAGLGAKMMGGAGRAVGSGLGIPRAGQQLAPKDEDF